EHILADKRNKPAQRRRFESSNIFSIQKNSPCGWRKESEQKVDQSTLPRSGRPYDHRCGAGNKFQRQAFEHLRSIGVVEIDVFVDDLTSHHFRVNLQQSFFSLKRETEDLSHPSISCQAAFEVI